MPFLEKTEVDFSMENKDSKAIPIQNTLLTGILLALVGGFLDAYTYLFRGGVFANAQTGNMVLLAVYTAKGDFLKGVYYLIPIVAFFFGVLATECVGTYRGVFRGGPPADYWISAVRNPRCNRECDRILCVFHAGK